MSRPSSTSALWSAVFTAALLLQAAPASAWDISVGISSYLDDPFYVQSASGSHTWTTVQEGVRADQGTSSGIPNNWTFQTWDEIGGMWPSDVLDDTDPPTPPFTEAHIYHGDVTEEFWDSSEAFVYGALAAGSGVASGWAYDFQLVLNPFSSADIVLDEFAGSPAFIYMDSDLASDVGTAFGQIRLYSTDVGLSAPGGVNNPWAQQLETLTAGGTTVDEVASFSHLFSNSTASAVTYNLRLEGSVSVFAVPEPGVVALLGLGVLGLVARRRV